MPYTAEAKIVARRFITSVRRTARCNRCGGRPVEWHNDSHKTRTNSRIAHLVALGFPVTRIRAEVNACEPLCRRCHMEADGRLAALIASRPRKAGTVLPPKPCTACGRDAKPLRKGLCNRCDHISRKK